MEKKEVVKVYEALMAMPGMQETVKLDLKLTRQSVLLLHGVLERGLLKGPVEGVPDILELIGKQKLEEVSAMGELLLERAGLKEAYVKLKEL